MTGAEFWMPLKDAGVTFFSGVPCSLLTGILNACAADPDLCYVPAPREDAALGVASGAYLAGRSAGILLQNSGLGNIVNGLTSFNLLYRVPLFMVISWRGYEGKDAPEHLIMGAKMLDLLRLLEIPTEILEPPSAAAQVDGLLAAMRERATPVALIVKPGVVE